MIGEFRKFVMRGNVVDLAVGVIIGAAFGAIVTSLVNDIIMPPIGLALSGIDFKQIKIVLQAANEAANKPEVAINIGMFLNALISFVIIAFVLFLIIRAINSMMTKEAEKPAAPPAPSTEEKLLMEIRDLLAKRQ
jgi:large conductance mechanosensitive channel